MTAILRMGTMSGSLQLKEYTPEIKLPINYVENWQDVAMSALAIRRATYMVFRCQGPSHFDKDLYVYNFCGLSKE